MSKRLVKMALVVWDDAHFSDEPDTPEPEAPLREIAVGHFLGQGNNAISIAQESFFNDTIRRKLTVPNDMVVSQLHIEVEWDDETQEWGKVRYEVPE